MGRIHIELPERFPFETELEVRVGDLNYGNHLGNDSVLTLVHEARRRYLHALGVEEIGADGVGFVVADAAVVYRAQAFHGDRLRFQLAAGELQSRGCTVFCRVSGAADGRTVAEVRTGLVCFDFRAQKTLVLPEALRLKLEGKG